MISWRALSRRFPWLDIPALLLIVIVGVLSFKYEDFKDDFPRLITWQLRTYQWITDLGLGKPNAESVTPIEIDDTTFYDFFGNETRDEITDRRFLAQLVDAATQAQAAVIALDINLDEARFDTQRDAPESLNADDQALLDAIRRAQAVKIPVVLTFGLRRDQVPVPQVFDNQVVYEGKGISYEFPEDESPPRPYWIARFGFDHPGDDFRKVPLVAVGHDDQGNSFDFYSFALQITDSFEHRGNKTALEDKALVDRLTRHEFVYTSFMPVSAFVDPRLQVDRDHTGSLSAVEVFCSPGFEKKQEKKQNWNMQICDQQNRTRMQLALELISGHIVLIGGNRHAYKGEHDEDDYLDDHDSPVGPIRGMYYQANCVEGLLSGRILFKVNRWAAALIDVGLAILMLWIVSLRRGTGTRLLVMLLLLVPAALAYFAATYFHRCLDFMFPLVLLLLHPAIEGYVRPHSQEVAHEEIAPHDAVVDRHADFAGESERRVAPAGSSSARPDHEQPTEEAGGESEESGLDEELDGRR